MDVLSLCPLPASPLVWELLPSRWVLTVVCKATFRLEPGVLSLAEEQEPLCGQDRYVDGDPGRSLFAPSDMVPFKPRADVVLVGSAHTKSAQPVRSLVARLSVGKVDKSIEVVCPRVRTRDGEIREGKRWTKMPVSYERAAGGPGTDNPVGMGPGSPRDPYGQLPLPCLLPVGFAQGPDKAPPPVGFGPIAAGWPPRKARIGRASPDRDPALAPFGDGFDPAYFQCAPPDQQIDTIRPAERITLESLHPRYPLFVTSLPGLVPRARVEIGSPPREIGFTGDTLWIDTDAGICTVTYRAKVDLERADQEGRVLVALAKGDQAIPWARLAPAPSAPSVVSVPPSPATAPPSVVVPPARQSALPAPPSPGPPARQSTIPAPSAPAPVVVPSARAATFAAPPPPLSASVEEELSESEVDIEITQSEGSILLLDETAPVRPITRPTPSVAGEGPALPFHAPPPGWRPPAATPSRPAAPPPPGPPDDLDVFSPRLARNTLPDWFESGTMRSSPEAPPPAAAPKTPPPPLLTATAPWAPLPAPPPLLAPPPGESFGLLEASNAAVRPPEAPVSRAAAEPEVRPSEARPAPPPAEFVVIELTWFDPAAAPLLAHLPRVALPGGQVKSAEPRPDDVRSQDGAAAEATLAEAVRGRFHEALSRGAPLGTSGLEAALDAAEEESPPRPAIVLVMGSLELCLDEVEMLGALVSAASPLATSDKKLKEVIDVAAEMLKAPMLGMPDVAQGLGARIREAWSKANRALPPDHLAACTERLLLEQRSYQKRELLDDAWIRALLSNGSHEVPVYLPAKISKRLPLFRRFPARLVAEVVWSQDQYETCPVALRALALGRLPGRGRGRAGKR